MYSLPSTGCGVEPTPRVTRGPTLRPIGSMRTRSSVGPSPCPWSWPRVAFGRPARGIGPPSPHRLSVAHCKRADSKSKQGRLASHWPIWIADSCSPSVVSSHDSATVARPPCKELEQQFRASLQSNQVCGAHQRGELQLPSVQGEAFFEADQSVCSSVGRSQLCLKRVRHRASLSLVSMLSALRFFVRSPCGAEAIHSSEMRNRMLRWLVRHAGTCVFGCSPSLSSAIRSQSASHFAPWAATKARLLRRSGI